MTSGERLRFRRVPPPTVAALEKLVRGISERVGRVLERQGLLVRDLENSFLMLESADVSDFDALLGHSITYRIALGPTTIRKYKRWPVSTTKNSRFSNAPPPTKAKAAS